MHTTRCTCTEAQLTFVGCDCDHTGPEKIVKSFDELAAEQEQAHFAHLADEEAKEIAYWDAQFAAAQFAAAQTDGYVDPREDYAEWTFKAAKYQ
jgi:hypothetical protein